MKRSDKIWLAAGALSAVFTAGAWYLANVHWNFDFDWWMFAILFFGVTGMGAAKISEEFIRTDQVDRTGSPPGN